MNTSREMTLTTTTTMAKEDRSSEEKREIDPKTPKPRLVKIKIKRLMEILSRLKKKKPLQLRRQSKPTADILSKQTREANVVAKAKKGNGTTIFQAKISRKKAVLVSTTKMNAKVNLLPSIVLLHKSNSIQLKLLLLRVAKLALQRMLRLRTKLRPRKIKSPTRRLKTDSQVLPMRMKNNRIESDSVECLLFTLRSISKTKI